MNLSTSTSSKARMAKGFIDQDEEGGDEERIERQVATGGVLQKMMEGTWLEKQCMEGYQFQPDKLKGALGKPK